MSAATRYWYFHAGHVQLGKPPSGLALEHAAGAMADTAAGRCPFCKAPMGEQERCPCWDGPGGGRQ